MGAAAGCPIATCVVFSSTLRNSFVWDDTPHIVRNSRIETVRGTATYPQQAEGRYYRPVVFLAHAVAPG